MDVYKNFPVLESENFIIREVRISDAYDLLQVYSDEKAVPFFNGDNCHGDDFHYTTKERMSEAIKFWQFSYDNGYFVRWSIVDKRIDAAVGTIELFQRDDTSPIYDNCGLLIMPAVYELFGDKVVTKVKFFATERLAAVKALGFVLPKEGFKLQNEEECRDYYVAKLTEA